MKHRQLPLLIAATLLTGAAATAVADDGELLRKSMSSSSGATLFPVPEAEHAFIDYMKFYVPAQSSDGTLLDAIPYINADGETVETREEARPLIGVYIYGPVVGVDGVGFVGHGARDAFAAVSLDDGNTWKRTNLSDSADKSSFEVSIPIPDPRATGGLEFDETGDWTISEVEYETKSNGGVLHAKGTDADRRARVYVRDALTREVYARSDRASKSGEWEIEQKKIQVDPCYVQAGDGAESWGPVARVEGVEDCPDEGGSTLITDYPGDVINIFHAVADNRVIVAWPSRFCQTGTPGYTVDAATVGGYLGIENTKDLYLTDLFGVAGSQGSVDYSGDEFEQNQPVGEVPFSCLWTARGVLRENPEAPGTTEVVWFKPERLTSGRRDVNRVEIQMVEGAGAAITWQEDPEGLRPGQGEGPGEGWSGAIANNQTDVWYSFLPWEQFDIVNDNGTAVALADYTGEEKPGHYVPFAVPMRLTNNAKCNVLEEGDDPATADDGYCYGDIASPYGLQDNCADAATIPQGQNREGEICIAESGLPNIGNTAATRPRLSLQPRTNDDGVTDSAWVVVIAEEDKGFGRYFFLVGEDGAVTATPCEEGAENCEVADQGKNIWYFSFDMGDPQTSLAADGTTPAQDDPTSLVSNLVSQGNMLNQPETDWRTGAFYPPMDTANMWNFIGINEGGADYNFSLYRTEIARRGSLLVQGTAKVALGESGLTALPSWKQGLLNQGGPADVMVRRIVWSNGGTTPSECTIDVDPDAPVVTSARYVVNSAGGKQLKVTVTGADGDTSTKLQLRNAVSTDLYGFARSLPAEPNPVTYVVNVREDLWGPIPCAIQVADGDSAFGNWAVVADAPSCEPEIPSECLTEGGVSLAAAGNGSENPYDFANMVCESWAVDPGTNPYYPKGLCADSAINLSSVTPETCSTAGSSAADGVCPTIAEDGTTLDDPADQQIFDKTSTWFQCPGSLLCTEEGVLGSNLDDQSWHNPLDVAKGHRGFLDGDFVMMLYAWSPNWKLNAVGNDRYELYIRRSFDGGLTWTTTPGGSDGGYTGTDGVSVTGMGTTTCETMRDGTTSQDNSQRCQFYGAGMDEQARNVSQLKSNNFTILDPRYAPTGGPRAGSVLDAGLPTYEPTDVRDASRFFVVYETGDNTTTALGEPEPLDLFYGRGVRYGDDYQVWSEEDTALTTCLPDGSEDYPVADNDFCNEFDDLEGRRDTESGEASLVASPAGDFLYSVWAQAKHDENGELDESDAMFRRVWYLDDYIPSDAPINQDGE